MTGNGKVTLAKLEQKLCDCQTYHGSTLKRIETNQEKLVEKINDVNRILTTGDGKIKRNYSLIVDHRNEHFEEKKLFIGNMKVYLAATAVIVAIVSIVVNVFI